MKIYFLYLNDLYLKNKNSYMKVEQKGHTTTIRDTQGNAQMFLEKLTQAYQSYKNTHLILDVTHDKTITNKEIKSFSALSKLHKKAKKSFVIVAQDIDFNAVPVDLAVVPTLVEAHDIIALEEIERDLGF